MFQKSLSILSFLFMTAVLSGQYKKDVTHPDSSKTMITDMEIPRVRYAENITPRELKMHLDVLASPEMEGRETGTPGNDLASEYISRHLFNLGLLPIPGKNSYFQPVSFTFNKWLKNECTINGTTYKHLWDYLIFPGDNPGDEIKTDDIVFLGYGIDDTKYNDYAKKEVRGKVILINSGEPMMNDSISLLTGTTQKSDWSEGLTKKLEAAKKYGVKAVLIIDQDIKKTLETNRRKILGSFLELGDLREKEYPYPTHVLISSTIAENIIGNKQKKIIKARKKIGKGKPASVVLPASFSLVLEKETKVLESRNVIGYIEGSTFKDEYVVVSAHFDHLGKRGDDIFFGADDNGSGSSLLLELAQSFQQGVLEGNKPKRNIVFIWFTGEEKGLLGSKYYSEYPVFPMEKTVVDVNIDMVGRSDDNYGNFTNYTYVIGSDRLSSDLHAIHEEANQKYTGLVLDYKYNDENDPNQFYFRSDHYNFASKGVPIIFFFTGTHKDYHRPTDTVDKILFDKMARLGKHVFHTIYELANRQDRIRVDGAIK